MDLKIKKPEDYMFEYMDDDYESEIEADIKAYHDKETDNYMVVINGSVFEMDSNANMPNGVNLYSGEIDEFKNIDLGDEIEYENLPDGVKKGIQNRLN